MAELKGGILQAVANPKQFLWAPFELAIMNILLSVAFMLLCIAVFGLTPFFAMIPLTIGHIVLVVLGARDQHLFTTIKAIGKYPGSRKNLSEIKHGAKFVP